MEVTGKIIELLEPKSGQSARGSWKKQDFIIETDESFPKKICISNWNDKIDLSAVKLGTEVTAHINLESREYNGNWYTDIKVWKLDLTSKAEKAAGTGAPSAGSDSLPPWDLEPDNNDDDQALPF